MKKIKILLVTGNVASGNALRKILTSDTDFAVIAEANNAYVARDKILECEPDVMVIEQEIPRMSGIAFLKKLMPQHPMPVVLLIPPGMESEAYQAGAAAVVCRIEREQPKPELLKAAILKAAGTDQRERTAVTHSPKPSEDRKKQEEKAQESKYQRKLIAIGASTGGTEAIYQVVKALKKDIPGIVMVQHMPPGFTKMYAQRLQNECEVSVKEAQTGDVVKTGHVLLAPGDKQMKLVKVNGVYQVECRKGPKVSGHCPSVDVLFDSVARVAGQEAVGVLMTGMGQDGAKGLYAMRQAGAVTIGQDEKTCVVYGMPKVAYEMGAITYQVPLEQIAQKLYYVIGKRTEKR